MALAVIPIFQGLALFDPAAAADSLLSADPLAAQSGLAAVQKSLQEDGLDEKPVRDLVWLIDRYDDVLAKDRRVAVDELKQLLAGKLRAVPRERWVQATARISYPGKISFLGYGPASQARDEEGVASTGDACMRRGETQMRCGRFVEAAVHFARAYDLYLAMDLNQKMDRALQARRAALNYADADVQGGEAARLRQRLKTIARLIRKHHQAGEFFWEALALAERGDAWLALGRPALARHSLEKGCSLFMRLGEFYSAAAVLERVCVAMGAASSDIGELADAFQRAGRLFERSGDQEGAVKNYHQALHFFTRLEEWNRVEKLAAWLAAHYSENKQRDAFGQAALIRAYAFEKIGDLEMAVFLYRDATKAFAEGNAFAKAAAAMGFLHGVYEKQGLGGKAERSWQVAINISAKSFEGENGPAPLYFAMGQALLDMGVIREAIASLEKALDFSLRRSKLFLAMVCETLAEAYLELGDGRTADSYFTQAFWHYRFAGNQDALSRLVGRMAGLQAG